MLTSTYVHLNGIGYSTEQRIWRAGALCWDDFLRDPPARTGQLASRVRRMAGEIEESREALAAGNFRYFSKALAQRDHWRAFPEFRDRILYLDIETTGSGESTEVTLIGVHDGRRMMRYMRGENLLEAEDVLWDAAMLVTYNGRGFDVPVLRDLFPRLKLDQIHIDLCHTLHRLGYSGGLKSVERQMGLVRAPELAGMGGWDAVRLWYEHLHGSEEALDLFLRYNQADVENLIPLARFVYDELRGKALWEGIGTEYATAVGAAS